MKPEHPATANRGYTRRRFLLTFAAGLASAGIYGCQRETTGTNEAVPGSWPAWLTASVGDPAAAARLGNSYLQTHPEENSGTLLLRLLDQAIATDNTAATQQKTEPMEALRHRVQTDYAQNTVVRVNGWVLSVTEARLYGLVAIIQSTTARAPDLTG